MYSIPSEMRDLIMSCPRVRVSANFTNVAWRRWKITLVDTEVSESSWLPMAAYWGLFSVTLLKCLWKLREDMFC